MNEHEIFFFYLGSPFSELEDRPFAPDEPLGLRLPVSELKEPVMTEVAVGEVGGLEAFEEMDMADSGGMCPKG